MLVKIKKQNGELVQFECDGFINNVDCIQFYKLSGSKNNIKKVVYEYNANKNKVKKVFNSIQKTIADGLVYELSGNDNFDCIGYDAYIHADRFQKAILSNKIVIYNESKFDNNFWYSKGNKVCLYTKGA